LTETIYLILIGELKLIDKALLDWFCLINTKGVGPKTFWALMRSYKTASESLKHVNNPFSRDKAEKILSKMDGNVILANEPEFPKSLRRSCSCPPMLFYKGDKSILPKRKIGIVGARNCSINGRSIARNLSRSLAGEFAIVSGMARGIDTSVHLGSLEKEGNKATISVIPFGINRIYPKENERLYKNIQENGILLTAVPPEATPEQGMFHARNKIIATMVDCLIVIEAAAKSGTLAAAKAAIDSGCEVMAVPGSPTDPRSFGSNYLIKNGATLVQNYNDVLDALNFGKSIQESPIPLDNEIVPEKDQEDVTEKILSSLSTNATSLDELSHYVNISMQQLLPIVSELEIEGKIVKCSMNEIALAR
jgi:DNA processing protein